MWPKTNVGERKTRFHHSSHAGVAWEAWSGWWRLSESRWRLQQAYSCHDDSAFSLLTCTHEPRITHSFTNEQASSLSPQTMECIKLHHHSIFKSTKVGLLVTPDLYHPLMASVEPSIKVIVICNVNSIELINNPLAIEYNMYSTTHVSYYSCKPVNFLSSLSLL